MGNCYLPRTENTEFRISIQLNSSLVRIEQEKITRRMENQSRVRFCIHLGSSSCKDCKTTNTFHQIQTDLTCFTKDDSTKMIADIGCPNTVISEEDETIFVQNLSKYQQQQVQRVKANEKFKFGPSGPYPCYSKLKFPVRNGSKFL